MELYKIYALNIDPFIVSECVELAQAIYDDDKETLQGWADYIIDEVTETLSAHDIPADIIGFILTNKRSTICDDSKSSNAIIDKQE